MPTPLVQYIRQIEANEALQRQGIETRKPVDHCTDCGKPMHESPISADDTPDADLNPLRIGAP